MMTHIGTLVPGAVSDGGRRTITAAFDDSTLGTVDTVGAQTVELALSTAFRKFRTRADWIPIPERMAILQKTADLMEAAAEDLALTAAQEGGKPMVDSRVEVARAIDSIRTCAELPRIKAGEVIPMNLNRASEGRIAFTQLEPIGVVVAISAFNHPLNLVAHQIGPAVAAGCPFIVKPSDDAPRSCFRLVSMMHEAGLPPEFGQALLTTNSDVASKLATDHRVGFLSFIGSSRVGWMLRAHLAPGTRCALEHGGAAPAIVHASANLDKAVSSLVKGGFYHAGQVCVSVQRIFVDRLILSDFLSRFIPTVRQLRVGDPTSDETDVGPLIRHTEVERVDAWVRDAVTEGAEVLTGGRRISSSCYEPTVLLNPSQTSLISRLEVFGPVVCIYPFDDVDDAIASANSLQTAFQAAVFAQDIDFALRISRLFDASAVMINDHTAFRVDWMPFAGLKESGLGVGGIPYTFREMQIEKMVVVKG